MKLLTLLLATLCLLAAPSAAQTVKAVSFNTTNNTVVSTNRIIFPLLGAAGGTAAIPSFTVASGTNTFGIFASTQVGIGVHLGFSVDGTRRFLIATNTIRAEQPITFSTTNIAAETRTNLGVPLPALTNTSNVTVMRALAGSTNTNEPFSGVINFFDFNEDANTVTISNGIIINWQQ
jgi:hypothetical protein